MTPTEWIWWLALVGLILVVVWQEWEQSKKDEDFEDEQKYSEWLEERQYAIELSKYPDDTNPDLIEYKRELWHAYHAETTAIAEEMENDDNSL